MAAAVAVVAGLAAVPLSTASAAAPTPPVHTVVATGLDNPRQLSLSRGTLHIAEAGNAVGRSSRVSVIRRVESRRSPAVPLTLAGGFFSVGDPDTGTFAVGVDGVSAHRGVVHAVSTSGPLCDVRGPQYRKYAAQAGKLFRISGSGRVHVRTDISAYEYAYNPDSGTITVDPEHQDCQYGDAAPGSQVTDTNSNPYAVLTQTDRVLIADAGGNTIYSQRPDRPLEVFAVLKARNGRHAVPASLAADAAGNVYVGEVYEGPGGSRVWRLDRNGTVTGFLGGFASVTGLAVGRGGDLYVSELFANKVTKVRFSAPTKRVSTPVPWPAGLAVGRSGDLYVSAFSVSDSDGGVVDGPGGTTTLAPGQVWRLPGRAFGGS